MPPPINPPNVAKRLPQIDVLRGIAVVLVIFRHLTYTWSGSGTGLVWQFVEIIHRGGWIGVDIFFVLSGFLVSGLLFKEYLATGKLRVGRFLIRRGFKIYPSFWVFILASVIAYRVFHASYSKYALVSELLFLQSYGPSIWEHTWTLAVEEHFYLGLAGLVFFLVKSTPVNRQPFQSVPLIAGVVCVMTLVNRIWTCIYYPWSFRGNVFVTHLRIDSLLFGVMLSWFFWFHPQRLKLFVLKWKRWLGLGGLLLLTPPFVYPLEESRYMASIGFTMLYIAAGAILMVALYSPVRMGAGLGVLAQVGFFSYSIYLWHMVVLKWIIPRIGKFVPGWNFSWHVCLSLSGSIVLGIIVAKLVEIPALQLRERLFPNTSKVASRTAYLTLSKS